MYPLATAWPARLNTIAALDDIGLERDGSRPAVQLQEEAAGIAENGTRLVASPEGCGACSAVLADRLLIVSTSTSSSMVECYRLDKRQKLENRI